MRPRSNWNRRTFLGSIAALAGTVAAPKKLYASARDADRAVKSGFGHSGNPYEELGLTTVINCEGTMTMLGGSLPHPELEAVMMQAGRHFVSIPELEVAAGNKIAEMLKLPDGYTALVTSGAAAAMQSGLAGILTGSNENYIRQLPDLTGLKVGSDHPEIASQPVRSSTALNRREVDRDRNARRSAKSGQRSHGHDALYQLRQ